MKITVGQYRVLYKYNPLGRYYVFWFYYHGKCIYSATLFKPARFIEALKYCREVLDEWRLQGKITLKHTHMTNDGEIVHIGERR